MTMNDESLMVEMVEIFLDKAPVAMEKMKTHHRQEEWDLLAREAHKIKPNLEYMGMRDSKDLIEKIESLAENEQGTSEMEESLQKLELHLKQAIGELKARLKENF